MMDGVCIYRKGTGRSPQPVLEESRMKTRATEWWEVGREERSEG